MRVVFLSYTPLSLILLLRPPWLVLGSISLLPICTPSRGEVSSPNSGTVHDRGMRSAITLLPCTCQPPTVITIRSVHSTAIQTSLGIATYTPLLLNKLCMVSLLFIPSTPSLPDTIIPACSPPVPWPLLYFIISSL